MNLQSLYLDRCNTKHNIDRHMPVLRDYASRCQHITEFGTDIGFSTTAFLSARPKALHSYDLECTDWALFLQEMATDEGLYYRFHRANTLNCPVIEETDLLFVDTEHTYAQVKAELGRHGAQVRDYLIFHDIVSYPEIRRAIRRYTQDGWKQELWSLEQSGLAVYRRIR